MFSQVCVCPHVSITHDALNLTVQDTPGSAPSPPPRPKEIRPVDYPIPQPTVVTSGGNHWRPLQTCSFGAPPPERHLLVVTES